MIELYLSGASTPDGFQNLSYLSLGGYISSFKVPNGEVDGLFGGITEYSKLNRRPEYCLVVLKNTTSIKTNVLIKIDNENAALSVSTVAVVEPSRDQNNDYIFEIIPDKWSSPLYADFDESGDGVVIASLAIGAVYGIWVRRTLNDAAYTPVPSADLIAAFDAVVQPFPGVVTQNLDDKQYKSDTYETDDIVLSISYM